MRRVAALAAILALVSLASMPSRAAAETVIGGAIQHGEIIAWYEPTNVAGTGATGLATVLRTEAWAGDVYALQLIMTRRATTTESFRVEVRVGDPTGTLLGTSEAVGPDSVPVEPSTGWVVARFFVPVPVEPGVDYAIVLQPGLDTGSVAASYGWVSTAVPIGPEAEWVGATAGWTHDGAGPWTFDDPVTHRTALLAITLGLRCSVLFDDGFKWWPGGVVEVGQPREFVLYDFIPASDVDVQLTHHTSGRTLTLSGIYGFGAVDTVWPTHVFQAEDIGTWDVIGVQADGRTCTDNPRPSTLEVLAAPVEPTPTPTQGPLPNTGTGPVDSRTIVPVASIGWLLLGVAAAVSVKPLKARRSRSR